MSGWPALFWTAFKRSRNGMALLDEDRRYVEVNPAFVELLGTRRPRLVGHRAAERVVGGPLMTPGEWRVALGRREFSGVARLERDDGAAVAVQFAGHPEILTGRRYVLAVALSHSKYRHAARMRPATGEKLSARESEVVDLIARGKSGPEIAEQLQIAHNTVRTHASNAMTKLGARSRAHLVAKALGEGHVAG
jgi:PAS domain S-box-containing protein